MRRHKHSLGSKKKNSPNMFNVYIQHFQAAGMKKINTVFKLKRSVLFCDFGD